MAAKYLQNKMFLNYSTQVYIKSAFSGPRPSLTFERPLKMMKNALYFTLKALFVFRCLYFCLDFLVM